MSKRDETVLDRPEDSDRAALGYGGVPTGLRDEDALIDRTVMDHSAGMDDLSPDADPAKTTQGPVPMALADDYLPFDDEFVDQTHVDPPLLEEERGLFDGPIEATRQEFHPLANDDEDEIEVEPEPLAELMPEPRPDLSLGFDDATDVARSSPLPSSTGEGDDEFDSATIRSEREELALEADRADEAPHGVDFIAERHVDLRGPTLQRPALDRADPAADSIDDPEPYPESFDPRRERGPGRPSSAVERSASASRSGPPIATRSPSVPPGNRDALIPHPPIARSSSAPSLPTPSWPPRNSQAPRAQQGFQVLNRGSLAPSDPARSSQDLPLLDDPRATLPPERRPSKPPGFASFAPSDELWISEHVETAKRTAKILPIALAGGISIAFAWVAFGGGQLGDMSDHMKEEAAEVYARRSAASGHDSAHAADPLIHILSDPPGARVEVNNIELGRTPLLAPSPYTNAEYFLVIMLDGHKDWEGHLRREKKDRIKIQVREQNYGGSEETLNRNAAGYPQILIRLAPSE